jgi:hypothetical protein
LPAQPPARPGKAVGWRSRLRRCIGRWRYPRAVAGRLRVRSWGVVGFLRPHVRPYHRTAWRTRVVRLIIGRPADRAIRIIHGQTGPFKAAAMMRPLRPAHARPWRIGLA